MGCCGQPTRRRRPSPAPIPENPVVAGGTRLIYLGGGHATLEGRMSGLTYHVAPHRRDFVADRRDVPKFLRQRDVILGPGETVGRR